MFSVVANQLVGTRYPFTDPVFISICSTLDTLYKVSETRKKPRKYWIFEALPQEARAGFEPAIRVLQTRALPLGYRAIFINDSYGNRTRVTAVKGRCLNRLTKEP